MNFKGHSTSGAVVGVGIAAGAVQYGYIDGDDLQTQVAVAGTALFFALFPDLDTSSVPQRWSDARHGTARRAPTRQIRRPVRPLRTRQLA